MSERRPARGDALRALVLSRVLVWASGVVGALVVGFAGNQPRPEAVRSFGSFGNVIAAPATAWDANSYVRIAGHGYETLFSKAFFPLYPLLVRIVSWFTRSAWVAAVAVSVLSLLAALYLMHRLVSLELGARYARPAVLLLAFAPVSVFFSAAYTESLFLCLTIGSVYAARLERWALAGALGGLAAMTRNTGVLLLIPLLVLYLNAERRGRARARVRPGILWLAAVPLGLGAVLAYMGIAYGDALAPIHAVQQVWHRDSAPLIGVVRGLPVAFHSVEQLAAGSGHLFTLASGPFSGADAVARYNLVDWAFLAAAVIGTVGVFRRLPLAYGLYSAVAVAAAASASLRVEPLISLPRYVSVIFPLYMWLAAWATDRRRVPHVLAISGVLLIVFSAQFATWRWVA